MLYMLPVTNTLGYNTAPSNTSLKSVMVYFLCYTCMWVALMTNGLAYNTSLYSKMMFLDPNQVY